MEVWQIVVYGVAGLAAARSLASLCTYHKQRFLSELQQEAEDQRIAELEKQKAEQAAAKAKAKQDSRAKTKGTAA